MVIRIHRTNSCFTEPPSEEYPSRTCPRHRMGQLQDVWRRSSPHGHDRIRLAQARILANNRLQDSMGSPRTLGVHHQVGKGARPSHYSEPCNSISISGVSTTPDNFSTVPRPRKVAEPCTRPAGSKVEGSQDTKLEAVEELTEPTRCYG